MEKTTLKFNWLVLSGVAVLIIVFAAIGLDIFISNWNKQIISENKSSTEKAALLLDTLSVHFIDSLKLNSFDKDLLSNTEKLILDHKLTELSTRTFSDIQGMEGGFFFSVINEFIGYSYPTSPPPVPYYGPPPRSYKIIYDQALATIKSKQLITGLHKFDPAVFPLTTAPVTYKGKIIGAVWTRIHIEREFPILKIKNAINILAAFSIFGFIIAILLTLRMRQKVEEIKRGLENVQRNPAYRLKEMTGMFGYITQSINSMVDSIHDENEKRQLLEKELHQNDKMVALGKLIAGVAHEVKTPLAIIKTRVQIWEKELRGTELPEKLTEVLNKETIQLVVNEINRLSNLVKRLLIFAKPSSAPRGKEDINKLLMKTLTLLQSDITENNINISFELDVDIPPFRFDPNPMEQVFINLYTNAAEAMTEKKHLTIRSFYNAEFNCAEITITDTGSGIPEDIKEKIFDPFFSTKDHGAGLGLSIAFEVIRNHNGRIEFITPEEKGTICKITLPIT